MSQEDFQNSVPEEQQEYGVEGSFRDFDERQRLLKDRVLLIGENLIDTKESLLNSVAEIKKDIEVLKDELSKVVDVVKRLSEEIDTKARKEDFAVLQRQAKMFQPIKLATLDEVKELIKKSRR